MIFLDTSAIFALLDRNDNNHKQAQRLFRRAIKQNKQFVVHNYLLVETLALVQNRLGIKIAMEFVQGLGKFSIVWITPRIHQQAVLYYMQYATRRLSFVDCVSFIVMQQEGIKRALAFDDDFRKAGFKLSP